MVLINIPDGDRARLSQIIQVSEIAMKLSSLSIKTAESSLKCTDPQAAGFIFLNYQNDISGDAVRIARIVEITLKKLCFPVKAMQPSTVCANPKHASAVFVNRADG